jgi:hypothetical protein
MMFYELLVLMASSERLLLNAEKKNVEGNAYDQFLNTIIERACDLSADTGNEAFSQANL